MIKHFTTAAAIAALITPALAMSSSAQEIDANGDGLLTIEEVQAAHPEVTAESFSAMDMNGDGALDEDEVAAAREAGLMPAAE